MSNIVTANVTIKGVRPLFWHHFGPDALPLEKGERTGVAGNDPEEWRRTMMATRDGQLYLEGTYVFSTMKEGAKYTKRGKSPLMKSVAATLQVMTDRVLIDRHFPGFPNGHSFDPAKADPPERDPDLPVYLDVRGVVNPSTKARNVRYRIVAAPGWSASFELVWDKTVVSRAEMQAVLIDSGKLVGIGNARTIGMGRFSVEKFEVVD